MTEDQSVRPPEMGNRQLALVLLTLWLTLFTQSSQFLIVAPILPRIQEQLNVPESLLGTLVSGYAVMVALFALIAGPISDRVGRRRILRIGSFAMMVSLNAHYFAYDYSSLMVLRMTAGATSGFMAGAAAAYVGDAMPYERRGMAMGVIMSAMAFGQLFGIPAGAMLAARYPFQSAFVTFGAIMVVAWLLTLFVLPDTGYVSRNRTPLTIRRALGTYLTLLKRPEIAAMAISSTLMMLSVSLYITYQPAWFEAEFDASPDQVASLFILGGLANASLGPVAGWASDRVGRKAMVVVSSFGLAILMPITAWLPSFFWAYPLFFVVMSMVAMRISPYNALLTALTGQDHRGSLMSLSMAFSQAGFAVGAALAGWVYAGTGYWATAVAAGAGAAVVGVIIGLFIPEPSGDHAAA